MLDALKALAVLLVFNALGETLTSAGNLSVPGAVVGMLLLFIVLSVSKRPTPTWLLNGSLLLIRLMSLFFLPAAVGLFFLPDKFHAQWPAILSAIVVATLISLSLTALLLNKLISPPSEKTATGDEA